MRRQLRIEPRHLNGAIRNALILALLISPRAVRIAAAASPTFLGTFTTAGLCSPRGVGLSPTGDVFVGSDCVNPHMVHFTNAGGLVGTWTFPPRYSGSPNGVAVDGSGNVFVTDYDGGSVLKYTSSGALITSWGSLSQPVALAVDGPGNVYVLELSGQQVRKFTSGGALLATFGSAGTGPGQFQVPEGIALDAGGRIYVADGGRNRILRFLADGTFDMEFTTPGAPSDVAVGPDGNLYVVGPNISAAYQYSPDGVLLGTFVPPDGFGTAFRIAIGPTGTIFIAEQSNNRISKFQIDQATDAVRVSFGRLKALYR
jgi:sugar lactone lactonase YvrE